MSRTRYFKFRNVQENLGGTKLRDEFGYDIKRKNPEEYWAAHPNGVS